MTTTIANLSLFLFFILHLAQSHPATSSIISVADFGAVGDGRTYDTSAIQSAIDSCSASGCHVVFPAGGVYLTAALRLKSGVILKIRPNATLLGGSRIEDYPGDRSKWYVVAAENATGVGITGGGTIDGQGSAFVERFEERKNVMVSWNQTGECSGDECRPRLVGFLGCTDVRVWNVTLTQPAYWWWVSLSLSLSHFLLLFHDDLD